MLEEGTDKKALSEHSRAKKVRQILRPHGRRLGFDDMDVTLTPEQEMVRSTAREFADKEIGPHAREWDRSEHMDPDIVPKLAEMGFLGAPLPDKYGGGGVVPARRGQTAPDRGGDGPGDGRPGGAGDGAARLKRAGFAAAQELKELSLFLSLFFLRTGF